jgi:pyruvate dehydrogenase E2 component (dihydrolipoamide acetyltransferase)
MIYGLIVPATLEDVTEVRILEWHGEPGQTFATGDLVVEFETHKAVIEVRAERPAVLRRVLSAAGDWQKLAGVIGVLSDSVDEPLEDALGDLKPIDMAYEIV